MMQKGTGPVARRLRSPVLAGVAPRAAAFAVLIGEEAVELAISLLLMILVERGYGRTGLGVFSYLLSCLFFVRYAANAGLSRYVEHETILLAGRPQQQQTVIARGYLAVMATSLAGAALLMATAVFDTSHTRVEEKLAAYFLVALIVPLANRNALNLAVLNASGRHTLVARLRLMRHLIILGTVFLLSRVRIAPSFLLAALLAAEIVLMRGLRRHNRLPRLSTLLVFRSTIGPTLSQSGAYVLTDNGLDILLNLDLFVLGMFVTAADLGVYAEVTILARCFLVIPVGIKTLLRRHYTLLAGSNRIASLKVLLRRRTVILFALHGILALWFLLNFPELLDLFFRLNGESAMALKIYYVLMPGLIYYSAFCAQEPVYEALNRPAALRRLTIVTALANLVLTFSLVPAMGVTGAAAATALTMLLHFLLFGKDLILAGSLNKAGFISAGLALYLVFKLFNTLGFRGLLNVWMAPLSLLLVLYLSGFFNIRPTRAEKF